MQHNNMELLEFYNDYNNKSTNSLESVLSMNNDSEKVNLLEKNIISTINTRLERIETHSQGLNLLAKYLPEVSTEALTKYFPHWIAKVTQILTNVHTDSLELTDVCKTLCSLIASCKRIPELDKRVSIFHVKQLIGIIVDKYDQNNSGALLNLLIVLLYYYPESCARFQQPLNKIISSCIDDVDEELVMCGAKTYSLLVKALERTFAHTSKNESIIFPENTSASCHVSHHISLCKNLYEIMDELFQDLVTSVSQLPFDFQNVSKINHLELPELSCHDLLKYYNDVQNRFSNICTYLTTLLKVGSNGGKKYVLPNVILQVICKGLSITPINLQRNDEGNRKDLLLFILPSIHINLLNVLSELINSFRQELLPFAATIQRLILQTLEWTQQYHKSFRKVRILAYKTLSLWLQQTGYLSGFQMVADEFLPHLLKDLTSSKKNVLVLSTKGSKNSSKSNNKKDKSKDAHDSKESNIEPDVVIHSDPLLSSEALTTIRSIASNANFYLKPRFYVELRNTIVTSLHEQYARKNSFTPDTSNTEYRFQLMKTLRILQTYGHISVPSPTSDSIQIFNKAIAQDEDADIVEEAKLGLAEIRHIIYPSAPSLKLPLTEPTNSSPPSSPTQKKQLDIDRLLPQKRNQRVLQNERKKAESPKRLKPETIKADRTSTDILESQMEIESSKTKEAVRSESPLLKEISINGKLNTEMNGEKNSANEKINTNGEEKSVNGKINAETNRDDEEMMMTFCDVTN